MSNELERRAIDEAHVDAVKNLCDVLLNALVPSESDGAGDPTKIACERFAMGLALARTAHEIAMAEIAKIKVV